jgi:uncharacterized protein (TIGR02186 family)
MRRALCLAALAVLGSGAALAQASMRLSAGLAAEEVEVKVNYSGAKVVLFAASPPGDDPSTGLAVAIIGPNEPGVIVRRTAKGDVRFPFSSAPAAFIAGAEPQVLETTSPEILQAAGLSATNYLVPGKVRASAADLALFRAALVDARMEQKVYAVEDAAIERLDGGLRRATLSLPPNAPTGKYQVRAVFFRNGAPISETSKDLKLVRGGLDATLFNLSNNHGIIYAYLALLLGTVVGGLAAWIGRRA